MCSVKAFHLSEWALSFELVSSSYNTSMGCREKRCLFCCHSRIKRTGLLWWSSSFVVVVCAKSRVTRHFNLPVITCNLSHCGIIEDVFLHPVYEMLWSRSASASLIAQVGRRRQQVRVRLGRWCLFLSDNTAQTPSTVSVKCPFCQSPETIFHCYLEYERHIWSSSSYTVTKDDLKLVLFLVLGIRGKMKVCGNF